MRSLGCQVLTKIKCRSVNRSYRAKMMGKPKSFKILFADNNFSIFFGGQTVTGRVCIANDTELTDINGK